MIKTDQVISTVVVSMVDKTGAAASTPNMPGLRFRGGPIPNGKCCLTEH